MMTFNVLAKETAGVTLGSTVTDLKPRFTGRTDPDTMMSYVALGQVT